MRFGSRVSTGIDARDDDLVEEVVALLVRVLRAGGITGGQIQSAVARCTGDEQNGRDEPPQGVVHLGAHQRYCMELMCHWRRDPEFCGSDGLPAKIPFSGTRGSFVVLCSKLAGAPPAAEVLELLRAFNAVRILPDKMIEAQTPTFILSGHETGGAIAFDGVLKQMLGYLGVVEYNVFARSPFVRPRFERSCSVVLPANVLPVAERFVRERGQDFVDTVDEWLIRQSHRNGDPGAQGIEIGAGAYFLHLGGTIIPKE